MAVVAANVMRSVAEVIASLSSDWILQVSVGVSVPSAVRTCSEAYRLWLADRAPRWDAAPAPGAVCAALFSTRPRTRGTPPDPSAPAETLNISPTAAPRWKSPRFARKVKALLPAAAAAIGQTETGTSATAK